MAQQEPETPTVRQPLAGAIQGTPQDIPIHAFDAYPTESVEPVKVDVLGEAGSLRLPGCVVARGDLVCKILARDVPAGTDLSVGRALTLALTRDGVTTTQSCRVVKRAECAIKVDDAEHAGLALTLQPLE